MHRRPVRAASMSAEMNFFERTRDFFRRLPRLRFLRPFAICLDWGAQTHISAPGRIIATLRVRGTGNVVIIDPSSSFTGHITMEGHNNRIVIGKDCELAGEIIVKGKNQTVTIGDETTFVSVYVLCMENKDITIGRRCMFSRGIEIRTSDAHALIDKKSGMRLNPAAPVVVGDHVWVGMRAILNKGTAIADDSVVGAQSFVNSAFDEGNIVIAGTPAKIIRRGVTWDRGRKRRYSRKEMDSWKMPPDIGG